jgi:hypothetical protein
MSAVARIGAGALDKAIFGHAPEKSLENMSVEELEGLFRVMEERQTLLWWAGFAGGLGGGAFGGFKLVALAAAL